MRILPASKKCYVAAVPVRHDMLVRLAALAFLLGLPLASAQAAPEASLALDVSPGPVEIALGDSHDTPLEVTLTIRGIVCASPASVKVPLSVKDKPSPLAGVRGILDPAELTFAIPAGSHSATPYTGSAASTLRVSVATDAQGAHEHEFEVTALYAGGVPNGCQAAGSIAAADAIGSHKIMTGAGSGTTPPSHAMGDGSSMSGAEHPASSKDTPAAGVALILAVAALVAISRRR